MSENERDVHLKPIEVGAEITRDDKTKDSSPDAERKRKLIEELTENVEQKPRELPKLKKIIAQIPESGRLGQKFTVRLGKKFDSVRLQVYQGETIEKVAGNDNAVHDKTEKNKDEISYDFYDPVPLQQRTINGLTIGKYLVKVEAHGKDADDQLEQERVIDITE